MQPARVWFSWSRNRRSPWGKDEWAEHVRSVEYETWDLRIPVSESLELRICLVECGIPGWRATCTSITHEGSKAHACINVYASSSALPPDSTHCEQEG